MAQERNTLTDTSTVDEVFNVLENEHVESLDSVPMALRGNYKESQNGGFDFVSPESARLKAALERTQHELGELKNGNQSKESNYQSQLEEAQAKIAEFEKAARSQRAGVTDEVFQKELDSATRAVVEGKDAEIAALKAQISERDEQITSLDSEYATAKLRDQIHSAVNELEVPVRDTLKPHFVQLATQAFSQRDDKGNHYAVGSDGSVLRDTDGQPLTPSGWAKQQMESAPDFFSFPRGGNSQPGGSSTLGQLTPEQVGKLSPREFAKWEESQTQ